MVLVPVLVVLFLYVVFEKLFRKNDNFRAKAYLDSVERQPMWKRLFIKIETFLGSRVRVSVQKQDSIQDMLDHLGWADTTQNVVAQQLIFGITATFAFLIMSVLMESKLLLFVSPIAGFYFYRFPVSQIKSAMRQMKEQAQMDFPDYGDRLILLLSSGITPYQALKKVQAPHSIKVASDRMIAELDTLPESVALDRFAEHLGIAEAKPFVRAMKQAIKTDKQGAQGILELQSKYLREMRVQNTRKLIKQRPQKAQMLVLGLFAFVVAIPLSIVAINVVQILGSVGQ